MNNAIFVIAPYRHSGFWVFDDEKRRISKEPFVAGADVVLNLCEKAISKNFSIAFSDKFIPDYTFRLKMSGKTQGNGTYYKTYISGSDTPFITIWLCSVLLKYFKDRPEEIFIMVKRKEK